MTSTRSCWSSIAAPTPPRPAPARRRARCGCTSSTRASRVSAMHAGGGWTSADRLPAHGLIATTDADSEPAPDWLRAQLDAVDAGALAIGGRIEIGAHDLPTAALERRAADAVRRHAALRGAGAREHHQFSGASLSVTAATYAQVGCSSRWRSSRTTASSRRCAVTACRSSGSPPCGHHFRAPCRPCPPRTGGRPAAQRLAGRTRLRGRGLPARVAAGRQRTAASA